MKKNRLVILAAVVALMFSSIGFAEELPFDKPLGEKQEHLFFVQDLPNHTLRDICSFRYVSEPNRIQILLGSDEDKRVEYGYDFAGKRTSSIAEGQYPVISENSVTLRALSENSSERIYLTRKQIVSDAADIEDIVYSEEEQGFEIRLMSFGEAFNEVGIDIAIYSGPYGQIRSLYTTDKCIVILYFDEHHIACVERYTFEGKRIGRVELNARVKGIVEGPDGSTIYIQKADPERVLGEDECDDPIEVVRINWEPEAIINDGSGPRSVIQERTRAGNTVARFTDHQFGLLRVEEQETGIVDYRAPIRSSENLVKLQIPYGDIKAKMESGARNLMVEYQGQTLTFPMELFACDDMLAAMPCQTDATIEIIMHTDETGDVTCDVQLFVVEQVNGMTRVVHRKTIQ
jgi:hypothetical protein